MSIKTKTAKTATVEVSQTVAQQIAADFAARATAMDERVAYLNTLDVSAMDSRAAADHKIELLAAANRAKRNAAFSRFMQNADFAQAFIDHALTAASVNALQLYAQDKLLDTVRAIGAGCALSSVAARGHANMMTQKLVAAITANGQLTVKDAPARMHDQDSKPSMGTYSAQASSSRQVLDLLGLLDWDMMTKSFKLNERGEDLRKVIAH